LIARVAIATRRTAAAAAARTTTATAAHTAATATAAARTTATAAHTAATATAAACAAGIIAAPPPARSSAVRLTFIAVAAGATGIVKTILATIAADQRPVSIGNVGDELARRIGIRLPGWIRRSARA
jgi:hypothetical protein